MRPGRRHRARTAPPRVSAASLFRQPAADFYTLPDLEVRGGRIVTDGCRRVLDFDAQKLQLDMGQCVVTFYGQALCIESLNKKRAVIGGKVARIEFAAKWGTEHASL